MAFIAWIKETFSPVEVNDRIYNNFIDNGEVPKKIIRLLAFKVMANEPLNTRELTIFYGKTAEVNEMIIYLMNEAK